MKNKPSLVDDRVKIMIEEFREKLKRKIGNSIVDLKIDKKARIVVLTGTVKSYYHKQNVSYIAQQMFPNDQIINNVKVLEETK